MTDTVETIGELRVRTNFNPSKTTNVDLIKQKTAELINLCATNTWEIGMDKSEWGRLCSLAQTKYEEGAMYAVKAATCKINN